MGQLGSAYLQAGSRRWRREHANTRLGAERYRRCGQRRFAVNLGTLDAGVYAILATATYQSASPDIESSESLPTVIKAYNGDPIVFSLVTNGRWVASDDGHRGAVFGRQKARIDRRAHRVGAINRRRDFRADCSRCTLRPLIRVWRAPRRRWRVLVPGNHMKRIRRYPQVRPDQDTHLRHSQVHALGRQLHLYNFCRSPGGA